MELSGTNQNGNLTYNVTGQNDRNPGPQTDYEKLTNELFTEVRSTLNQSQSEISQRNQTIYDNDQYVYGDKLLRMLDIPPGHDRTAVNWLRRVIEIHKTQFMGRPFQVISTYSVKDLDTAQDDQDKQRLQVENKKQKAMAELRMRTVKDIIRDNGGHALFADGAESAGVAGCFILKTWYDEDAKKFTLSPVEAVENCYAVWSRDDFRQYDLFGYAYQVSVETAQDDFGASKNVTTSPLGSPLEVIVPNSPSSQQSNQPMVTIMEATGIVEGWCSYNGKVRRCTPGEDETPVNLLFVGNELKRVIDVEKKLPKYYILPNKKARRRAWGLPDITEAAIELNLAYIEAFSDWRTVSSKVNFPKFKGFNFGPSSQFPKFKSRKIQVLPLGEGQDLAQLNTMDSGQLDFRNQLEEIKSQFSRETATAPILLDNDGVSNSNQALITSMKPTTDVAEIKKELWSPILAQLFDDAFETLAAYDNETYGDLADKADPWYLKVQWPSMIQKEDPIYQQMLLNRWNAGTLSLQSFLEAENESAEEIDRIRDEMTDMVTAAIHARSLGMLFNINFMPSPKSAPPKVNVNLRGDLDPYQVGNISYEHGFNGAQGDGTPYPTSAGPTGPAGQRADDNADNQGFINGQFPNQTPVMKGPNGQPIATPGNNQPGQQPMSQPGSGAPGASAQGALTQANQNQGG